MNQHQDYDKIFKENIEKIGLSLLQKLCGLELENVERATASLPRTLERRADFACIGTDIKTLLRMLNHLEFQANNHDKMDRRMLFYYALYYEFYGLPVKQYIIYLGPGNWTGAKKIEHERLNFSYEVIELNKIDYELFIHSENPEEIILAVLADFKGEKNATVIKKILTCLKNKTKKKQKLQKLLLQLEMLSNLRKLQPLVIKSLEDMSLNYDIQTDLRYLQGKEEGIEKGIDLGIEKGREEGIGLGIEKGIEQGASRAIHDVVVSLLTKFPNWSDVEIAEVANTTLENIARIRREIKK
jgi:predicted transposase/invertase (TIGR01784 family)